MNQHLQHLKSYVNTWVRIKNCHLSSKKKLIVTTTSIHFAFLKRWTRSCRAERRRRLATAAVAAGASPRAVAECARRSLVSHRAYVLGDGKYCNDVCTRHTRLPQLQLGTYSLRISGVTAGSSPALFQRKCGTAGMLGSCAVWLQTTP